MPTKKVLLGFRGEGIKTKFDLVLAFQDSPRQDDFKQLAWHVIKVPTGDSATGTVTYEGKFSVTTPTVDKGLVTELGHRWKVELGQQGELTGTGNDLGWNIKKMGVNLASDIWVVNNSDKKQKIYIHLVDPKSNYPAPILVTSTATGSTSRATFKPALTAYVAHHFPHDSDPVQSTANVNGVIDGFHDIDLTKLGTEAYYVITESDQGVYTIAPDPEWSKPPGTDYVSPRIRLVEMNMIPNI